MTELVNPFGPTGLVNPFETSEPAKLEVADLFNSLVHAVQFNPEQVEWDLSSALVQSSVPVAADAALHWGHTPRPNARLSLVYDDGAVLPGTPRRAREAFVFFASLHFPDEVVGRAPVCMWHWPGHWTFRAMAVDSKLTEEQWETGEDGAVQLVRWSGSFDLLVLSRSTVQSVRKGGFP